jgi:RES domain-containing protein
MAFRFEKAARIASSKHPIFDGTGASRFGARWNSPGRRIIYTADSFAGAMLEKLVHLNINRIPASESWIECPIPEDVSIDILDMVGLPGWDQEDQRVPRAYGDEWFDAKRSMVLVVPSIVTRSRSFNLLINQEHSEFHKLKPTSPQLVEWDQRLFSLRHRAR